MIFSIDFISKRRTTFFYIDHLSIRYRQGMNKCFKSWCLRHGLEVGCHELDGGWCYELGGWMDGRIRVDMIIRRRFI